MWHVIFNNLDINDSRLNVTAIKLLNSALDSHVQNKISSCKLAHDIWIELKNIYEQNCYEHLHVDYNESNDISLKFLMVENIVNTNKELK